MCSRLCARESSRVLQAWSTAVSAVLPTVAKSVGEAGPAVFAKFSATTAVSAVVPTVAKSVGEAWLAGIVKNSATTAGPVVVPTLSEAVGVVEAQLPEIAKCRAPTDFERTGCNNVYLSM